MNYYDLLAQWEALRLQDGKSYDEVCDIANELAEALKTILHESLAQSAGTTSDKQQTPAVPDDSAPSVRTESEDPGSC